MRLMKKGTLTLFLLLAISIPLSAQYVVQGVVTDSLTKEPLANKAYSITMPDGRIVSGVTDLNGSTSLNASDVIDDMTITLIKGR